QLGHAVAKRVIDCAFGDIASGNVGHGYLEWKCGERCSVHFKTVSHNHQDVRAPTSKYLAETTNSPAHCTRDGPGSVAVRKNRNSLCDHKAVFLYFGNGSSMASREMSTRDNQVQLKFRVGLDCTQQR